ncbi:unnamed protein product [Pieris macdunnoughi]|uniref:ATP-dependent DNA helicase n=1 Tax=Pieris macdunnoughi TaxID=345717 RepID=A0A821Y2F4_9NEOP|nr:unnamed protein product [Pieris macdunnoughi]
MNSYLKGRIQRVHVNGVTSPGSQVSMGVPQGSILGPFLFLIYINDLPFFVNEVHEMVLFADDTSLLFKVNRNNVLLDDVNNSISRIVNWFNVNNLLLNENKTKCIRFTTTSVKRDIGNLKIKDSELNFVDKTVFLGITIDSKLQWGPHIETLSNRLSSAAYAVKKIRQFTDEDTAKIVYHSYFHSVMSYGILLWVLLQRFNPYLCCRSGLFGVFVVFLRGSRQLANQFYVDMYVKVESERLRYITLNQTKLRAENYIHLQDAVANDANLNPNDIGRMIILPSSFVNSPRYLHEYTQDAFAYVRTYGRPDLFVTFTCNPAWPEIVNELMPGQSAIDRHDVVARVFRLKVKKLMSVISKGRIFGEVICFMYSIEWQKRGLPHVHILLWLKDKLRPDQIDNIISAEIPDPSTDKTLHDIIVKNMIHGPCGPENPQCPCMKDGKCTKKFPRKLHKDTVHSENGYPLYRRRAPADGGRTASVKLRNGSYVTIDNMRAIKYICKYINKGSDQAIFNFRSTELANRVNEVHTYQSGRYVSSNEAVWRLLGFPLHERHPTVTHLSVHLENGERVYFTEDNFHERLSTRPKTTLTAFFELCIRDEFARTLMYAEVPRYYTWDATRKTWKRRIQGTSVQNWPGVKSGDALGRVYTVHVTNMECFCLRMLLHHVRGPTSFNDLKKYNNQEFSTFREACEARGLLEDDNHWNITLEEAAQCRSAAKVRMLFAILIATCGLSNPQQLWERYKIQMADDILHRVQHHNPNVTYNDFIFNEALTKIEDQVITITGKDLSDFGLSRPQRTGEVCSDIIRELSYDAASLQQQITESVPRLNPEQKLVFENVVQKIESGEGGLFFLDAPGGTGKTFLLNLLLAQIRKDKGVAVAVASSGIAATLLNGGRTAHSVLKLPLNLAHEEMPVCNITKNSDRGRMLQQCKLLVWDECTMSHKRAIEALDRTIKDIKSNLSIMGGMVVLLAGDFRQTLPVITRGTPADEINACLKASPLWVHVKIFCLTTNMRVQLHSDTQLVQYADALLKIGEDRMETNSDGMITLNREFCNVVCNMDDLKNNVYPDLATNMKNRQWLCERAILAPTNEVVGQINE